MPTGSCTCAMEESTDTSTSTALGVIVRNLSSLGSKNLAHRRGRTFLTGLGIALGVALLFGVLVANRSVNQSFEHLVSQAGSRTTVIAVDDGFADFRAAIEGSLAAFSA